MTPSDEQQRAAAQIERTYNDVYQAVRPMWSDGDREADATYIARVGEVGQSTLVAMAMVARYNIAPSDVVLLAKLLRRVNDDT